MGSEGCIGFLVDLSRIIYMCERAFSDGVCDLVR